MRRRSQLYVPANNPRMVAKAASLEADSIVFDLEDAVPPDEKDAARKSVAAAAYGIDAIDRVYFDLEDGEGFRAEAVEARRLGYVGKQVVHPDQVRLANEIFAPTEEELAWAREVVQAYEAAARSGRGAIRVRNRLVDAVHYRDAKRVLERAG